MSKISYVLPVILVMALCISWLISGTPVLADTDETEIGDVTDPGILPDSGFYFFKTLSRNFQLMFAGNDAKKAELMLKYSNEDALALEELYGTGKYDAGAGHAEKYALQVQNTVQTIEQVRTGQGENASGELAGKMEQNYLQQQGVLLSVLEKAPEVAQNALLDAIENSNKSVASMIMAQNGELALQQYQEQVNQQTNNMGEETKIRVRQRLEVVHGQAAQSSGESSGQSVMTQTQTQTQNRTDNQMSQQTVQQSGTQNTQNSGTGQSAAQDSEAQDNDNGKQQGK